MTTHVGRTVAEPVNTDQQLDYHALNALLNLYDENGQIQFDKDREAANQYFIQHVNQNTVFFHDLEEKIDYLVDNAYYDPAVIEQYDFEFIKSLFKQAYGYKFRFQTFLGAYKYYTSYTLKTFDGRRYLERFEDRVSMTALFLADGDEEIAKAMVDEIMSGRFQPIWNRSAVPSTPPCSCPSAGEAWRCCCRTFANPAHRSSTLRTSLPV